MLGHRTRRRSHTGKDCYRIATILLAHALHICLTVWQFSDYHGPDRQSAQIVCNLAHVHSFSTHDELAGRALRRSSADIPYIRADSTYSPS